LTDTTKLHIISFFGSLAQLVEQRTFNPLVAGSNPARPTTNQQKAHEFTFVGFLLSARFGKARLPNGGIDNKFIAERPSPRRSIKIVSANHVTILLTIEERPCHRSKSNPATIL
jgi:hypothetical protein